MLRNIQTKLKTFLTLLKVIEKVANKKKLTSIKGRIKNRKFIKRPEQKKKSIHSMIEDIALILSD